MYLILDHLFYLALGILPFQMVTDYAHSALTAGSGVITSDGYWARGFQIDNSSDPNYEKTGAIGFSLKTSINGGLFDAPGNDTAISMRCWIRSTSGTRSQFSEDGVTLALRYNHEIAIDSKNQFPLNLRHGYGLTTRMTAGAVDWFLWATNRSGAVSENGFNTTAVFSSGVALPLPGFAPYPPLEMWIKVRLDFIPTGNALHQLNAYISADNNEANWVPLSSMTIQNGVNQYYNPTTAGQRVGFIIHSAGQGSGIPHAHSPLMDSFEVRYSSA